MHIIKFKIKELIDKYMLSQRKVAIECNIRPSTLKMYVDNSIQRINKEDLQNLYNFFHKLDDRIIVSDIVEFIEE
ncbi:XRE family transcriptional regulator [Clostridium sp. P21]|uniref:XRE family transcriptional regulator n=1 Tax=Clostridium muellerianum TaxID=2716538 RepID=A0A7Y0EJ00_9CLOT|nr:XRE family transcriptional regulator [Clostridium muellerianum]NMM64359.1 XRE family transcriptional regulator [Clostridium muellerianum]